MQMSFFLLNRLKFIFMFTFSLMGGGMISSHYRSDILLPIDSYTSKTLVSTDVIEPDMSER